VRSVAKRERFSRSGVDETDDQTYRLHARRYKGQQGRLRVNKASV